jgi:superfamily II DNA or RNA helicase
VALHCKIEAYPAYKIKVSGSLDLLETVYEFFESHKLIKEPRYLYGNKKTWTTTRLDVNLVERFERTAFPEPWLIVDRGYFVYLILYLYDLKQRHGIEYKTEVDPKSELKLTKEWKEILRDDQIKAFNEIVKLKGSATQIFTGYGKSELALAICFAFLKLHPDRNILITAPKNNVVEELKMRFEQYSYGDLLRKLSKKGETLFTLLPRIKIFNPLGYVRSKAFNDPLNDKWLSTVGMVIYDEMHRSTSNSYLQLKEKLINVDYAYGFSATNSTKRLNVVNNFRLFEYEEQKRIGMTGPAMVHKFAKDVGRSIDYIRVYGNFRKGDVADGTDYPNIVNSMTKEPKFLDALRTILTRCGDKMFFIPIRFIEAGERVYKYLMTYGINTLHWTGDFSLLPEHVKSLEDVKKEIKTGKYRALIATATASEGIDIAELNAVILSCGSGDKDIPQNLGRAGRRGKPLVFNIYNEEQQTLRNQATRRHTIINTHYETAPVRWDL